MEWELSGLDPAAQSMASGSRISCSQWNSCGGIGGTSQMWSKKKACVCAVGDSLVMTMSQHKQIVHDMIQLK